MRNLLHLVDDKYDRLQAVSCHVASLLPFCLEPLWVGGYCVVGADERALKVHGFEGLGEHGAFAGLTRTNNNLDEGVVGLHHA